MTYKELVDNIKEIVDNHLILADFGYGAITDIKTVDEGTRVDYPYAFLNPTQSTRTGQTITYRFNLIVMDVVQEDPTDGYNNYLKVQSACQQYIDDILANLRFATPLKDFDLTLNVNLTPFKERFQDTLAGMTATLEIEIPFALNNCITPYPAGPTTTTTTTTTTTAAPVQYWGEVDLSDQTVDPDPSGVSLTSIQPPTVDTLSRWNTNPNGGTPYVGFYVPDGGVTVTIEMSGTAEHTAPGTGEIVTQAPPTIVPHEIVGSSPTTNFEATLQSTNWPTTYTPGQFNWTATYEAVLPQSTGNTWSLNQVIRGNIGTPESSVRLLTTTIRYSGQ